jgi:hypothetical protein
MKWFTVDRDPLHSPPMDATDPPNNRLVPPGLLSSVVHAVESAAREWSYPRHDTSLRTLWPPMWMPRKKVNLVSLRNEYWCATSVAAPRQLIRWSPRLTSVYPKCFRRGARSGCGNQADRFFSSPSQQSPPRSSWAIRLIRRPVHDGRKGPAACSEVNSTALLFIE